MVLSNKGFDRLVIRVFIIYGSRHAKIWSWVSWRRRILWWLFCKVGDNPLCQYISGRPEQTPPCHLHWSNFLKSYCHIIFSKGVSVFLGYIFKYCQLTQIGQNGNRGCHSMVLGIPKCSLFHTSTAQEWQSNPTILLGIRTIETLFES